MTLMLLPSRDASPDLWGGVRERLVGIPVLAPSPPDPDTAEAEDRISLGAEAALRALDAAAVPRAAIAGHSHGGSVAILLALDHPDRVSGLGLVDPLVRTQLLDRLWEIRCRTHVLAGRDDRMAPAGVAALVAERISAARYTEYAGVGHALPVERPAEVAGELAVLWASTVDGRVTRGPGALAASGRSDRRQRRD